MVGVLFIVTVPQKDYETELREKGNSTKIALEKENHKKRTKLKEELKKHSRFRSTKSSIESYATDDDSSIVISKCESTDCLHSNSNSSEGLCKSKSENMLNEEYNDGYMKSPWEEMKQVMKAKRNKVNITRPVRGVDILGAFHWDTPLETILGEILTRLNINSAAWNATRDNRFWKVTFSLKSGQLCEELLQVLRTFGIGSRNQSSMSVLPCTLYYQCLGSEEDVNSTTNWQSEDSAWSRFSSSVRARNNLAQVLNVVRAEASLTFDWLFLLLVAAFVAAIGLVEGSTVILVASMLISPLMGPITAGTLGTAVRDRSLQHMGVLHELLGLFLALVVGFIFGLTICAVDERYGDGDWPTGEMMSRAEIRSLWLGVLVAIPSGAGVALAVLSEYTASLVGVAISASLLPPAVNAGLLWSMALVHLIFSDDATRFKRVVTSVRYSEDPTKELALLGTVSLCLTLVNIMCIFLSGVVVYKVKEVCPLERKDISWWRANRNLLRASKRQEQDPSAVWNLYSNWCNDSKGNLEDPKSPPPDPSPVQSDTVTYRRPGPGHRRLRAQNIEDYCLQGSKNPDSFTPLDIDSLEADTKISNNKDNYGKLSIDPSLNSNDNKSMNDLKSFHHSNYSFYNTGFEGDKESKNIDNTDDSDKTHYPTLEPSLNLTVDAKKHGIVLGTKSFHV